MTVRTVVEPTHPGALSTLPLNAIQPSGLNPRKHFDEASD